MSGHEIEVMNSTELPLPKYQTSGSSGFDFLAAVTEPIHLEPGCRATIPTGLHFAIPEGFELQVRGRSGLAAKFGIGLVNGIGTIDSDYRGEVQILLVNHGSESFIINRGDRIAQGVIARFERATWQPTLELSKTSRGQGGLGSTGASLEEGNISNN